MNRGLWIILGIIGVALAMLIFNHSSGSTLGFANDDFGQLIWLGVLGAVIGAGLLRSGRRFGEMFGTLGLWAVIVLGLIAGYQYRYELQDFASRVTAGLVPGSPLMLSVEDGRAAVTLDKARSGHFETLMTVNGKQISAVVDTGATSTVLTAEDARAVGFDPETLRYTVQVSTANGTASASAVRANEIAVGNIVRHDVPVLVAAPGALQQSLLGMNFIGSLSGFDVRGNRMTLRD